MPGFTNLLTPQQAKERFAQAYTPRPRGTERIPLTEAYGRILAAEAVAQDDLPPFDRSTVDGFAVRSVDVAGAAPELPAVLTLIRTAV